MNVKTHQITTRVDNYHQHPATEVLVRLLSICGSPANALSTQGYARPARPAVSPAKTQYISN